MANMNEKVNKISHLLSKFNFSISNDINADYKCGICKGIINNAHQANCGCNFCFACVRQMIESGSSKCEACEEEILSEISKNYGLNIQISKISVKCPNDNCDHECKLIEMAEHLNSCSLRAVECPFSDIGCQLNEISCDTLNEHFISNIVDHSKILIDLFGQMRNEMRELKEKEAKNHTQMEILIANDMKKDETIESLRNEINVIRQENQELKTLMRISNNNLWDKLDQMDIEMNDRCRNETLKSINDAIESIKIDKSELESQIKIIDKKCQQLNGNAQDIHQVKADRDEMTKSIDRINKFMKMRHNGRVLLQMGKINEMKYMLSDMFHDYHNPYQMQLQLVNTVGELNVELVIYSGELDEELQWPVKANMTIYIYSMIDPAKSITKSMSCTIDRSEIDSVEQSDKLSISRADLAALQMLDNNCLLGCSVEFE